MGFNIGRFLKKNLGTIGQVVGSANPLVGMILGAAGKMGGMSKGSTAVIDGISTLMGTGDWDAADFKTKYLADAEFRKDMMTLELQKEKEWQALHIQDLESARSAEQGRITKGSWITANINTLLAIFIHSLFGYVTVFLMWHPELKPSPMLMQIFELLKLTIVGITGYYFGSSQGSKDKTEAMHTQIKEK